MECFELRPSDDLLIAQMAALERVCFSLPWSERMIRAELDNPQSFYLAAARADILLGYAGVQIILDEGYITNIAVRPDCRRTGVADALLGALTGQARQKGASFLTLEVRRSNRAARGLYEKHGFQAVGMRPGYYEKPREDAVLYTKVVASLP